MNGVISKCLQHYDINFSDYDFRVTPRTRLSQCIVMVSVFSLSVKGNFVSIHAMNAHGLVEVRLE
jgi:hypothetical protein